MELKNGIGAMTTAENEIFIGDSGDKQILGWCWGTPPSPSRENPGHAERTQNSKFVISCNISKKKG